MERCDTSNARSSAKTMTPHRKVRTVLPQGTLRTQEEISRPKQTKDKYVHDKRKRARFRIEIPRARTLPNNSVSFRIYLYFKSRAFLVKVCVSVVEPSPVASKRSM